MTRCLNRKQPNFSQKLSKNSLIRIYLKATYEKHCDISTSGLMGGVSTVHRHWLSPENTNLRISVQLTSYLYCLDSAALLLLNEQQFHLFSHIQTSQRGGQPAVQWSPNGECSLLSHIMGHSLGILLHVNLFRFRQWKLVRLIGPESLATRKAFPRTSATSTTPPRASCPSSTAYVTFEIFFK